MDPYNAQFINELMNKALAERSADLPRLLEYLKGGLGMPAVEHKPLAPDMHGMYSYDTAVPGDPGLVEISNNSVNTLVHELTHAGQKQMVEQYAGGKAGKQFREGYEKLEPVAGVRSMAPQFAEAGKGYRTTRNESQAHAMGNQSQLPHPSMAAPPHVDATLATEFMILLDLALRDRKKGATQGAKP